MSARIQVARGGTAQLTSGYLRARLTGDVEGVRLDAVGPEGQDRVDSRESAGTVVVLPAVGAVRFSIADADGGAFRPGMRVGLALEVVATGAPSGDLPVALDVPRSDVGALRRLDLVSCRGEAGAWHVGVGVPAPSAFHVGGSDGVAERLDERAHEWVAPGRYVLRTARKGEDKPLSEEGWALVLDASASFAHAVGPALASEVAKVAAGLMAEATGTPPVWIGTTGLMSPVRTAESDPGAVVEGFDEQQPASWCLVRSCVEQAVGAGARMVMVIADGVPADLPRTMRQVAEPQAVDVLLVLLTDSDRDRRSSGESAGFAVVGLEVQRDLDVGAWDWDDVCVAVDGRKG